MQFERDFKFADFLNFVPIFLIQTLKGCNHLVKISFEFLYQWNVDSIGFCDNGSKYTKVNLF